MGPPPDLAQQLPQELKALLERLASNVRAEHKALHAEHERAASMERAVRALCACVGMEVPELEIDELDLVPMREVERTLGTLLPDREPTTGTTRHGRWGGSQG